MDYEIMVRQHVDSGADVTVGCLTVPREEASAFGVMDITEDMKITSFLEKPKDPPGMPGDPNRTLASMGIYVFKWKYLRELLLEDQKSDGSKHDFGGDIIPKIDPDLDLWDTNWPIWTYSESVPPAKFIHDEENRRGLAVSSMVSGGCIISGTEVRQSLLFTGVHTNSFAVLERVVALPYVVINRHSRLRNVVIDRGVEIPKGLVVGEDPAEDAKWFRVSEKGVTLITQDMIDKREASL